MIKSFLLQVYYSFVYYIPNFFSEIFSGKTSENSIVLNSYLDTRWGKWKPQNWGDDMNVYLSKLWFNKQVINKYSSLLSRVLKRETYSLIGSVLQNADKHTIVWGSGLISKDLCPKEQPKRICAVRGPLSRNVLMNHGIDCPEVYGDPVLLLPRFYAPQVKKVHKLGLLPHFYDEDNELIKSYLRANPSVKLISMKNYGTWQEVVDQIVSCEMIISSSLHGIIVSDAYKVPNVWVEFSDKVIGDGFKFQDHFGAVKRVVDAPVKISALEDFEFATGMIKDYQPATIDLEPLIKSCPFELNFNKLGNC